MKKSLDAYLFDRYILGNYLRNFILSLLSKYSGIQADENRMEEARDLAFDCYMIFIKKYSLKFSSFVDKKSIKNILFKIARNKVFLFIEKKKDEQWWNKLSIEERQMGLCPPSYYFHKKYFENNKGTINNRRRENYKNNPEEKAKRKARWERLKAKRALSPK